MSMKESAVELVNNEADDTSLIERAKQGDQEAFGELVRRHRSKIYGYAQKVTQESFMAEDIVQEALIRAFLHLGTLMDNSRFLLWLHRIVRNQAYTKLQSKSQIHEQVFSVLSPSRDEQGETDWSSLDSILGRLSRSVLHSPNAENSPEEWLVRKELLETIQGMLNCLNQKERQIIESHFFEHLSPREIAKLFQMSSANVYQILSRSKKKLIQEKIRVVVDQYVKNRKDLRAMTKKILKKPEILTGYSTWVSCAAAMTALVEATDRRLSLPMVMGLSGHAFRINIMEGDIHIAGPTMFDFSKLPSQGFRNMGIETSVVSDQMTTEQPGPNANLVSAQLLTVETKEKRKLSELLPKALELVHQSIDRGYPAMSWDLFLPEFGVIYGYDDEQQVFYAADNCGNDKTLPYNHLGRGLIQDLLVIAIDEVLETDQPTMLKNALEMILNHYQGKEERAPQSVNGLDAYDTWREAFRGGKIEPNGNAYNLAVIHDSRQYAAKFLEELAQTWLIASNTEWQGKNVEGISALCLEASKVYHKIVEQYQALCQLFPFPQGGEPNEPDQAEQAIQLLESVKGYEQEAVSLLEKVYQEVK